MRVPTVIALSSAFLGAALTVAQDCSQVHWTQQSVKYLAPGQGKCAYYTDDTKGACMNPDCIDDNDLCNKKIWISTPDGSTTVSNVAIVDGCPGITSCDSVWVTKSVFLALGGSLDAGNIYSPVQWGFQCDDEN